MKADDLTLAMVEKALGEPADKWEARCYEIAVKMVRLGLVEGVAVYGHYHGPICPWSPFFASSGGGFVHHGWIALSDGRVLDPTRWVFEGEEPYLYLGEFHSKEDEEFYDEGGNKVRTMLGRNNRPRYDESEQQRSFAAVSPEVWAHIASLVEDVLRESRELSIYETMWLANLPPETLRPFAAEIYAALEAMGLKAFIPIDNYRRVKGRRG